MEPRRLKKLKGLKMVRNRLRPGKLIPDTACR
jgi:hypothetical protein